MIVGAICWFLQLVAALSSSVGRKGIPHISELGPVSGPGI